MKKILILTVLVLALSPLVFSQYKAGKTDNRQHSSFATARDVMAQLSVKEQMKAYTSKNHNYPITINVTKHDPSMCPQCGIKRNLSDKEEMKAEVTKIYTCPMHPELPLDKNGICSKCKAPVEEKTM